MYLGLKGIIFAGFLSFSTISTATADVFNYDDDFYRIGSVEIQEVQTDSFGHETYETIEEKSFNGRNGRNGGILDQIDAGGRVIAMGKDLVALGESIYQLVIKGKPNTKTSYAPISVIPKVNGQPADVFETEGWSAPVKRTYEIKYRNLYNIAVIQFQYSVMYSYRGTYNGTGAYLTAVQVIPERVKAMFGWDFEATMKLGGLQNQGTRTNPVAGATIMIEYTAKSVMNSISQVNSFFITGKGGFKKL